MEFIVALLIIATTMSGGILVIEWGEGFDTKWLAILKIWTILGILVGSIFFWYSIFIFLGWIE